MQNPAKGALRQLIAKVLKGISAENQQIQSDKITQKVKRFIIYVLATSSGTITSWNRLSHTRPLIPDTHFMIQFYRYDFREGLGIE